METDVIVVGGGSAGAAVANRLTEDPDLEVTLLEAGGSDRHPFCLIPAASSLAIASPKLNWMYPVEPDQSRGGRVDIWPAGRVLGGGSSINGMIFIRGHKSDYDNWADKGASGWSYSDVLPYFIRLESNERGADEYRGDAGPQPVSEVRIKHPLTQAWIEAAQNMGIERNPDLNGEKQEGVGFCQASQGSGWRASTARSYIWPIRSRINFKLRLNTRVVRILLENGRAVGVEYVDAKGETTQLRARRGVVMAAGAIASPKLLMLSGIGPRAHLEENGIECLHEMPGVGQNLMEHAGVIMSWHVNTASIGSSKNPLTYMKNGLEYLFGGRGPLSTSIGHAQALVKTESGMQAPNIQIIMLPFSYDFDDKGAKLYTKPSIGVAVGLGRPESRGELQLRSGNPEDKPKIHYQLVGSQREIDQMISGCKVARDIVNSEPFSKYLTDERLPGQSVQTDAELEKFIRDNAFPMYHVSGTCRMGNDDEAVTDPELRVRGLDNLWVVDASIIPSLPAGNINASVIMIGEKGADHIKQHLSQTNQTGGKME